MSEAKPDPVIEAKLKLMDKLSSLPGWGVVKPSPYSSEQALYKWVYETWEKNWDPTDQRYYHVVSSQTLLAHRWKEFDTMAHLYFYGPAHSGKGQALKLFQQLCPKPLLFSSISAAAIYQTVDLLHPMLLMDECDRLGGEFTEYVEAMLQLLNVYEHEEVAIRASREGGIIKLYDLFCPKVLAGQNPLPGSLPDRCIKLDCEKNAKDVPIDIDVPVELRGQLEYYAARHALYNGLTKEQLKTLIGDNRITQLYYSLYAVCPSPEGQKDLLDLAREQLAERDSEEGYNELAEVTERLCEEYWKALGSPGETVSAVFSVSRGKKPLPIALSDLGTSWETMPKDKDPNRWLGWVLRKLQFKRERKAGVRYVLVDPRTLHKKARRYAPHYLLETAKTDETASQQSLTGQGPESESIQPSLTDITEQG